jgi:uracil-DNA glycosylase
MNNPQLPDDRSPVATPMSARPFMPDDLDWKALQKASMKCQGCPLFVHATQTVFGEGPLSAKWMLVGEQPGDSEDRGGRPFIGPAGGILDKALAEIGVDREHVYVTNAVKHFKWEHSATGGRRLHAKPSRREVEACRPWLEAEIALVRPERLVCLGATAAQSLLGTDVRIGDERGKVLRGTGYAPLVMVTAHPSSILRLADEDRGSAFTDLVDDLKTMEAAQLAP